MPNLHAGALHSLKPQEKKRQKSPATAVSNGLPSESKESRGESLLSRRPLHESSLSAEDDDENPRRGSNTVRDHMVGPGAYELPQIFGKHHFVSNVSDTPAYSIGSSARLMLESGSGGTLPVADSMGLGRRPNLTPGVCYYSPKFVLPKSPSFVPTRAKRFGEEDDPTKEKRLPITHVQDIFDPPKRYGVCTIHKGIGRIPKGDAVRAEEAGGPSWAGRLQRIRTPDAGGAAETGTTVL